MEQLTVDVPGGKYSLFIGKDIAQEKLADFFKTSPAKKCAVITNELLASLYGSKIEALFPPGITVSLIAIKDGESYKTLETASQILDKLFEAGLMRNDCAVCFGGGVVGDIGAFSSAIYLRGIDFVQMPTTLLAMVDSSVGGKTGVNHPTSKNSIGTFTQPKMVVMDTAFLTTLPKRQLLSGLSEILKHSLIKDRKFFDELSSADFFNLDPLSASFEKILLRSCQIKADVVSQDEREAGPRMLLNFGHTFGHLIETMTNYSQYMHGEAVYGGMEFAAHFSHRLGHLSEEDYKTIKAAIAPPGLQITLPALTAEKISAIVARDKKNRSQGLNFVFLKSIGEAFSAKVSVDDAVHEFIAFVRSGSKLMRFSPS